MTTAPYPDIFSPFCLAHLKLKNRIVVPPMLQLRLMTSPQGIAWYRRLAGGGSAWITVEVTSVWRFGQDLTVQSLTPLVQAIHSQGAFAGIQLFPVEFGAPQDPNTVALARINQTLDAYANAASICKQAGFDAVEPHGAHGYLINQFFMPDRNGRTDAYGGSLANRARLATQIVQSIRNAVGGAYLIFYRHTPVGKAYTLDDSLQFAPLLLDAGVNVLDISPARQTTEADLAAPFKRFGVPVIAVNGMEDPMNASRALREGRCDLIAIGRALIADAQLPRKLLENRPNEILACMKCDAGCFGHLKTNQPVYCAAWEKDEVAPYVA